MLAIGGLIVAAAVWWLTVRDPLQAADLEQTPQFTGTYPTRAHSASVFLDAGNSLLDAIVVRRGDRAW